MILELGSTMEMLRVTAEYSNAVLVAVLPYVSDFSQKLDLPLTQPITAEQVVGCGIVPYRDGPIGVRLKGGWSFVFTHGYINKFEAPNSYFGLQNPDDVPRFYGHVRMSEKEAVQFARKTITKLGIPLEQVFAELDPQVTPPPKVGTNTVPYYRIEWLDPRGIRSVEVDLNADAKRVERLWFLNKNLEKPLPKIAVSPAIRPVRSPAVNPAYAWKLLPILFHAVDDYGAKLGLPIPRPLTTNQIARLSLHDNGGWPHCEIELTNGWRFVYRNSMVNGYYAPDNLFNSDQRPILIKEFVGKWKMTESEAIDLVRRAVAKLDYPTNRIHADFRPEVRKPAIVGKEVIPRFFIEWNYIVQDELESKVEAEVDAEKRQLKSFYYDDVSCWNHPPPIDVPLSLPRDASTNSVPPIAGPQTHGPLRGSSRTLTPFIPPEKN